MKSALIGVLFLLFAMGVFGDAETVSVSVIEGESVTLHTGVTKILRDDVMEWRLNESRIARISDGCINPNGAYNNRMKLDKQTGDLKITNIKTTDSGQYKLQITTITRSSEKIFSVNVVTDHRFDGVTVVSVTEGYSVVLHTDDTEILNDDEILWRFRNVHVIAKKKKDEDIYTYDDIADGIFRGRLQLNHQTGNLIISDIRSNTSGLYEVDVKKRTHTIHNAFNVTVTDRLSVKKGVTVILASGVTELHRDDLVQWRFEHEDILAKINKTAGISSTSAGPDGRFRDRLELDHQTGSLIITNT